VCQRRPPLLPLPPSQKTTSKINENPRRSLLHFAPQSVRALSDARSTHRTR
jgi:hypothetical protein